MATVSAVVDHDSLIPLILYMTVMATVSAVVDHDSLIPLILYMTESWPQWVLLLTMILSFL